jgi:glycosyltransferase involved in cell wall biosynthesis
MACNLPIVATDVGDVRELISNTGACYISKPQVDEFVDRLGQVLRHRGRTRGREHVRALANGVVAQKLIRVYEEILKRRA